MNRTKTILEILWTFVSLMGLYLIFCMITVLAGAYLNRIGFTLWPVGILSYWLILGVYYQFFSRAIPYVIHKSG